ncbi:MAG: hypothetical protein WDO24_13285 [Pseudomonadota bacterium]
MPRAVIELVELGPLRHRRAASPDPARPQTPRARQGARDRAAHPAARRGHGRPAPDRDRPDGRRAARAQPRYRHGDPVDRACDAP